MNKINNNSTSTATNNIKLKDNYIKEDTENTKENINQILNNYSINDNIKKIDKYIELWNLTKAHKTIVLLLKDENITDKEKSILFEKNWDILLEYWIDYKKVIKEYYKSKELWNNNISIKIVNLLQDNIWDNYELILEIIKEELIEATQNNIEESYSKLAEILYYYEWRIDDAIKILEEWNKKWSKECNQLHLKILEESLIKNNTYSISDQEKIITKYNDFINNNSNTELYNKLWLFYKKIWRYYESLTTFQKNIQINWNYISIKEYIEVLKVYWKQMHVLNDKNINTILISQYKLLEQMSFINNDHENLKYSYLNLLEIYDKLWDKNNINYYENLLLSFAFNNWDIELQEKMIIRIIYKDNLSIEEETKMWILLLKINPKHLITLWNRMEEKWNILWALTMYIRWQYIWIKDSNTMIWLLIEKLSKDDYSWLLKNISEKAYNNETLNYEELHILEEFIKF